ncbi:MAG: NAD(+)/NADH kinase [Candidatus Peribacteraceae bacterium]|nr:NAD(+)/NADH kinase [Candidatus Peribacteraceae bacterium]
MLEPHLNSIALVGGQNSHSRKSYFQRVVRFLEKQDKEVYLDKSVAKILQRKAASSREIKRVDLILVFGGDGALLGAARDYFGAIGKFAGIRLDGTLGFLTEFAPENLEQLLRQFFSGKFESSPRILLTAEIHRKGKIVHTFRALNEFVLNQNRVARLIALDFDFDSKRIATFHADGAIIATPTGSTAYSLSAGGPILDPNLEAVILTPINPHLLAARPLVLPANGKIHAKIDQANLMLTADGQKNSLLKTGDEIIFRKADWELEVIHPKKRNHFAILRRKLNWSERKT